MKATERSPITLETTLYALVFVLALGLRLTNLGAAPLSETEASFAMQSFKLARGQPFDISTQPVYVTLTGVIFTLFKDSTATARLTPALAGSLLVFLPLLFGSLTRLSAQTRQAGLILALGIALDPALVSLARTAGSPILALTFLFLALGFFWRGSALGTGILGSLALLSGPDLLTGLFGAGIALAAGWTCARAGVIHLKENPFPSTEAHNRSFWLTSLAYAAGTFLIVGLLWLRVPQGLSGLANLAPAYLEGWTRSSAIPALRLPMAIVLYQPLLVLFGVAAAGRVWIRSGSAHSTVDNLSKLFSLGAVAALLPGMLYPARQVSDASWALIPLWALTALEISRMLPGNLARSLRLPALGLAGVFALFLILIGYNLLRLNNLQAQPILYAAIIGGLLLMALIVTILVSLGWHPAVGITGLAWGFTMIFTVYMFAGMWGLSQVRVNQPAELWIEGVGTGQPEVLLRTIDQLSQWKTGLHQTLEIVVNVESPGLQWALRHHSNVTYTKTKSVPVGQQPAILITDAGQAQSISRNYRGQELVWNRIPAWEGTLPPNLLRWITFREMPTTTQTIILWARNDLFPGGSASMPESQP
jgi:hypothetical protein